MRKKLPAGSIPPAMMELIKKHFFWDEQENQVEFGKGFVMAAVILALIYISAFS